MWGLHNLLWWVILILGIVVLVRVLGGTSRSAAPATPAPETSRDLLNKRYVRGEIGKEEFEQKKRDIAE